MNKVLPGDHPLQVVHAGFLPALGLVVLVVGWLGGQPVWGVWGSGSWRRSACSSCC